MLELSPNVFSQVKYRLNQSEIVLSELATATSTLLEFFLGIILAEIIGVGEF